MHIYTSKRGRFFVIIYSYNDKSLDLLLELLIDILLEGGANDEADEHSIPTL